MTDTFYLSIFWSFCLAYIYFNFRCKDLMGKVLGCLIFIVVVAFTAIVLKQ